MPWPRRRIPKKPPHCDPTGGTGSLPPALLCAAVVLALLANPQDDIRAERERAAEIAEELAEELEATAEELLGRPSHRVGG